MGSIQFIFSSHMRRKKREWGNILLFPYVPLYFPYIIDTFFLYGCCTHFFNTETCCPFFSGKKLASLVCYIHSIMLYNLFTLQSTRFQIVFIKNKNDFFFYFCSCFMLLNKLSNLIN